MLCWRFQALYNIGSHLPFILLRERERESSAGQPANSSGANERKAAGDKGEGEPGFEIDQVA